MVLTFWRTLYIVLRGRVENENVSNKCCFVHRYESNYSIAIGFTTLKKAIYIENKYIFSMAAILVPGGGGRECCGSNRSIGHKHRLCKFSCFLQ